MRYRILLLLLVSGLFGFITSLYVHRDRNVSSNNNVQVIQTFHYPATFVKQLKGDPRAGEKIYKEFCATCHAKQPIVDVHAPLIGDKKAWDIRQKMGMPALLKLTIHGVGAMPARGGCFECSDEQLKETIRYLMNS